MNLPDSRIRVAARAIANDPGQLHGLRPDGNYRPSLTAAAALAGIRRHDRRLAIQAACRVLAALDKVQP